MATNDFLPFATGVGANVLSQTDYAALPAVSSGYQSGIAKSQQLNKTWRQSSIMAAVLAQFIVDQTGANATDDGTIATLLANLKKSMPGRWINNQIFTLSGTYTPTPGTTKIRATLLGGGAAGGGTTATPSGAIAAGSGGGAGASTQVIMTSGFSGGIAVTVGAGGLPVSGNTGGNGGQSSFGPNITAPGGQGGPTGSLFTGNYGIIGQGAGGALGVATAAGIISSVLGRGQSGLLGLLLNTVYASGQGAPSILGGGAGNNAGGGGGASAQSYGAGGAGAAAGASTAAQSGGAGAAGIVIVEEFA